MKVRLYSSERGPGKLNIVLRSDVVNSLKMTPIRLFTFLAHPLHCSCELSIHRLVSVALVLADSNKVVNVNKDGRLIRLDYVFSKLAAPGDARKHNQSYQTPRLPFLSFRFPRCYS